MTGSFSKPFPPFPRLSGTSRLGQVQIAAAEPLSPSPRDGDRRTESGQWDSRSDQTTTAGPLITTPPRPMMRGGWLLGAGAGSANNLTTSRAWTTAWPMFEMKKDRPGWQMILSASFPRCWRAVRPGMIPFNFHWSCNRQRSQFPASCGRRHYGLSTQPPPPSVRGSMEPAPYMLPVLPLCLQWLFQHVVEKINDGQKGLPCWRREEGEEAKMKHAQIVGRQKPILLWRKNQKRKVVCEKKHQK